MAEPWWGDPTIETFIAAGFRPVLTRLRVFFPKRPEPLTVHVTHVSEKADVALLHFDARDENFPALTLEKSPEAPVIGEKVLLIGYPSGIDSLLARTDPVTRENSVLNGRAVLREITAELSRKGLIRPLMTWGHLSDVRPYGLTYDAPTARGGSGSPVINSRGNVMGISRAIFPGLSAVNFGVPITYGLELMKGAN